jgi:hypothetical protein
MEQRALGSQGLRVSAIGLGCMVMSKSYWPGALRRTPPLSGGEPAGPAGAAHPGGPGRHREGGEKLLTNELTSTDTTDQLLGPGVPGARLGGISG